MILLLVGCSASARPGRQAFEKPLFLCTEPSWSRGLDFVRICPEILRIAATPYERLPQAARLATGIFRLRSRGECRCSDRSAPPCFCTHWLPGLPWRQKLMLRGNREQPRPRSGCSKMGTIERPDRHESREARLFRLDRVIRSGMIAARNLITGRNWPEGTRNSHASKQLR